MNRQPNRLDRKHGTVVMTPRTINRNRVYGAPPVRQAAPYHPSTHPRLDEKTEVLKHSLDRRMQMLESELNETHKKLCSVDTENKALQLLINRQGKALKDYESLPEIFDKHKEEVKSLKTAYKMENAKVRKLEHQLMKCRCGPWKHDDLKHSEEVEILSAIVQEQELKIENLICCMTQDATVYQTRLDELQEKLASTQKELSEKILECYEISLMKDFSYPDACKAGPSKTGRGEGGDLDNIPYLEDNIVTSNSAGDVKAVKSKSKILNEKSEGIPDLGPKYDKYESATEKAIIKNERIQKEEEKALKQRPHVINSVKHRNETISDTNCLILDSEEKSTFFSSLRNYEKERPNSKTSRTSSNQTKRATIFTAHNNNLNRNKHNSPIEDLHAGRPTNRISKR